MERSDSSSISGKKCLIAGLVTTIFGLEELPPEASEVACLWLLHPRLSTQEWMASIAASVVGHWNKTVLEGYADSQGVKGLIAVSFDQRNHGTRENRPLANESWNKGNPQHAQDMFSIFQGTARDVSILMDYLEVYTFPRSERAITTHLALGVSLGGHAAWSCLFHEPRIRSGVVVVGCPDYINLMADRARLTKLPSWVDSDPPGCKFLGSEAFSPSLLKAVRRYDPAGLVLSHMDSAAKDVPIRRESLPEPSLEDRQVLEPLLTRCLFGKRILILSGGADKLVPYHCGEPFLTWLKKAIAPHGWFNNGGVHIEDIIFEDAGHELAPAMMPEIKRFIHTVLSCPEGKPINPGPVREARM